MQDAYPSQAEGGLAGCVSSDLKRALKVWDQKRFDAKPKRMAAICIRRDKAPKRHEVSWNPKPEVLREKRIKVPRDPKPKIVRQPRVLLTPEERRAINAERNRVRRRGMSPEKKAAYLQRRKELWRLANPVPRPVGRQITEEKRQKRLEATRRWKAKQKAKHENETKQPS